jgi:hypothetical protein
MGQRARKVSKKPEKNGIQLVATLLGFQFKSELVNAQNGLLKHLKCLSKIKRRVYCT